MGELDAPIVVAFPLRGEWTAENTPAHRIPSHGTDMLGQRYAFDFVRTDHRRGFHLHPAGTLRAWLMGGRTRDCYGWGQPVHAAFDGEVVAAVDGVGEREWLHVVREVALVLKNAVTFNPANGVTPLAGNHVVIRMDGACGFYAHLAPGSVAVKQGDIVRAVDVIGRVPHRELHRAAAALPTHGCRRPAGERGDPVPVREVRSRARRPVGRGRARHPAQARTDPVDPMVVTAL